ncbi:MAG: hypothetical protein LBB55_04890 [Zoogloeaceae bacterium]|jgi:hypothetical protein|nr:hypothetical protein [Zoogloeaceae bacterium]
MTTRRIVLLFVITNVVTAFVSSFFLKDYLRTRAHTIIVQSVENWLVSWRVTDNIFYKEWAFDISAGNTGMAKCSIEGVFSSYINIIDRCLDKSSCNDLIDERIDDDLMDIINEADGIESPKFCSRGSYGEN